MGGLLDPHDGGGFRNNGGSMMNYDTTFVQPQ